ncbi:TTC22 [Branchiostoma lanceolatum]|uniref:TTC22 protein n=1 Tax=Branchiostoma lanceolatum TaxID=7740 RepID=A0A8J9ZHY5_BRALA|nr:TTC22 [Branchiostoma lanceolatum]
MMSGGGLNLPSNIPTPGFFHLDLFLKDTKDVSQWYDELKTRLHRETGPMESAMTNLLSVFAFYKLRGIKGEARKLLENLTETDKENLNAIANKQFIYGQLMRVNDEMACRDRLQELLAEESDAARARNARCFAEQGYALAFEVRDGSKDMVSKIRNAISLFDRALSLVCNTDAVTVEECLVWKYYMSKCYWWLDQVRGHDEKDKATSTPDDRLKDLLEAQRLLIEVTQLDPCWEHGEFYIALSWALLGALEGKCRRNFESYETPDYIIKEIPHPRESSVGPEFGCYKKSLEINPNDHEAYRRFGESYLRNKLYENARHMLDKAIDMMPNSTSKWFEYHIRSMVNMEQYDQQAKQSRRERSVMPSKRLLRLAKEDAIASCEGATTPFNVCQLGKVCHRLAIHPESQEVEYWVEIGNALDNFAQALQLEDGYTDPKIHAARGRSLESAGEYGKAAESYKRAVERDDTGYVWSLLGVLKNLLLIYKSKFGPSEHYIAELAFWINEGYKKYKDITPVIRYCVFNFAGQMMQVCQYLIDHGNFQLSRICLECFQGHISIRYRTDAESLMSKISKTPENGASGEVATPSTKSGKPTARVNLPVAVEKPRHS